MNSYRCVSGSVYVPVLDHIRSPASVGQSRFRAGVTTLGVWIGPYLLGEIPSDWPCEFVILFEGPVRCIRARIRCYIFWLGFPAGLCSQFLRAYSATLDVADAAPSLGSGGGGLS